MNSGYSIIYVYKGVFKMQVYKDIHLSRIEFLNIIYNLIIDPYFIASDFNNIEDFVKSFKEFIDCTDEEVYLFFKDGEEFFPDEEMLSELYEKLISEDE